MLIWPRMRPGDTKRTIAEIASAPLSVLEEPRDLLAGGLLWAPTGGTRVVREQAELLRERLRSAAVAAGYLYGVPDAERVPPDAAMKAELDFRLASVLHGTAEISPHEASDGGMWAWMTCRVVPELVRWRFGGETTTLERFGQNRQRNLVSRLWWRAEYLMDEDAADPYHLLRTLGEDEQVQIAERPNTAGYRPQVLALLDALLCMFDPSVHRNRAELLRDMMKNVVRRLPLICMEGLLPEEIAAAMQGLVADTLEQAGYGRPVWRRRPGLDWQEISLERRYLFMEALPDAELAELPGDPSLPDHGETDARWQRLYTLSGPVPELLERVSTGVRRRLVNRLKAAEGLNSWMQAERAGSWSREVIPGRDAAFVQALPLAAVRRLCAAYGWPPLRGDLLGIGVRQELRRRYGGDWQTLIAQLTDGELEPLRSQLPQEAGTLRERIGLWLTGRAAGERTPDRGADVPPVAGGGAPGSAPAVSDELPGTGDEITEEIPSAGVPVTEEGGAAPSAEAVPVAGETPPPAEAVPVAGETVPVVGETVPVVGETSPPAEAAVNAGAAPVAAPDVPELPLSPDMPLKDVPGMVQMIVSHLGLRTVRDCLLVDAAQLTGIQRVGRGKIEAFWNFRKTLIARVEGWEEPELEPEPGPEPEAGAPVQIAEEYLTAPIPEPPGLIRTVLQHLRIRTVGDLLLTEPEALNALPMVGKKKVESFVAFRALVLQRHRAAVPVQEGAGPDSTEGPDVPPVGEAPDPFVDCTVPELCMEMLNVLDDRSRRCIEDRFLFGQTLSEIGVLIMVSRERVRQIVKRAIQLIREQFLASCTRLLKAQLEHGRLGDNIIHRSLLRDGAGLEMLELVAEVVDERWKREGDTLVLDVQFSELVGTVKTWAAGRYSIPQEDVEAFTELDPRFTPELLQLILSDDLEMVRQEGEWVQLGDRRAWLEWRLQSAGGPVHQKEIGAWLAQREHQIQDTRHAINAERILMSLLEVYRCGGGTFVHRQHLPVPPARIQQILSGAMDIFRNSPDQISTRVILRRLEAAGQDISGMNHWLLKDLLSRQPEVKTLRKTLVAWTATFTGQGMDLAAHVEAVLRREGRPLSLDEIMAELPADSAYQKSSVYNCLIHDDVARSVERGLFEWAGEEG